ncbi:MAG: ABC transporter permease [Anaerolineales bacterium]|nr:ABC transporter permease [Anaerolineales bacterium]
MLNSAAQNATAAAPLRRPRSLLRDTLQRLTKDVFVVICAVYLAALLVIAIAPGVFAPVGYAVTDFPEKFQPPGTVATQGTLAGHTYWMGSDKLGRDILSRLIYGTRVSMAVALMGASISFVIGITYGLVAGYSSKHVDNFMMRIVDIIYAYPTLILIILLQVYLTTLAQKPPDEMGAFGQLVVTIDNASGGLFFVFVAIGVVSWLNMARLVRGQTLHYRQQEFVQAARVVGAKDQRIMGRHLLPNIIGPCIVAETLAIPTYIYTEAFLSFIGLGIQPPLPSWGSMIADGYGAMRTAPWVLFFPAIALSLTMLAFNFLGDALRDALDPKTRK